MDVSVVIINYNTFQLTSDCVRSVLKHTHGLSFEIILVDNASDSFPEEDFKSEFPTVKLVVSDRNLGFAGGNNLGIQHSTGRYILLLNSDTYLRDNAILTTLRYMDEHPEAGVVSARLVYPDGRHQSVAQRFPSVKYQLIELLRLQKFLSKEAAGRLLLGAFFDHSQNAVVDWVWGAYFLFRREILDQLPGRKLDDRYFMYFEDMQWCLDISKLGYEIHFCSEAEVVHLMGGSAGKKSKLMIENEAVFMRHNFTPVKAALIRKLQRLLA